MATIHISAITSRLKMMENAVRSAGFIPPKDWMFSTAGAIEEKQQEDNKTHKPH